MPDESVTELVSIQTGRVRGSTSVEGVKSFLGIPYATPPIGPLRWKAPQPPNNWAGVHDATSYGPQCWQPDPLLDFYASPRDEMDEDCLYLNVWSAATSRNEKRPVMVWLHGGALVEGAGSLYPGAELAQRGVVIVTVNYRLGPFGFFAHPELSAENNGLGSGNQGYKDQIAALKWVRDNIEAFGGDPANVTIFGESAGSWSVSVLQASPLAKGLFHKAIGQSGARFLPLPYLSEDRPYALSAEAAGVKFGERLVGKADYSIEDLRALPAKQIMQIYGTDPELLWNFDAMTIVDGEVLPNSVSEIFAAGEQSDVPVLIGSTKHESDMFMPDAQDPAKSSELDFQAMFPELVSQILPEASDELLELYPIATNHEARRSYFDFQTDAQFTQPVRRWGELMSTVTSPAFVYWWEWAPTINGDQSRGAFHAADVPYVFGNLGTNDPFNFVIDETDVEVAFSRLIATMWTNFAKTGNPSVAGALDWPEFHSDNPAIVVLGPELQVKDAIRNENVTLISNAYERRLEIVVE